MRRSILGSFLIVGAVAAILATVTIAPFSDSETSYGNTVAAGTLDLTVNGLDDPDLGVVCTVGPLAESTTVYCDPILVKNVGNLDGIADIHFVASSCSGGDAPESETPGVCDIDENLEVDVVYDEEPDGACSPCGCDWACSCCDNPGCWFHDLACARVVEWDCDCNGGPGMPDDETMYLPPTLLPTILSQDIDLGDLKAGETDEICISFHLAALDNGDQGDIANLDIQFTLHEELGD